MSYDFLHTYVVKVRDLDVNIKGGKIEGKQLTHEAHSIGKFPVSTPVS